MRIISGSLKGRRLNPPANLPVRPTTDMAREGLFNILNNYVDYEDCSVMDLFTGTGAVAVEFISRGVREVTAIDINNACTEYVKSEASRLDLKNLHVVRADVFDLLKRANRKFDIVFADPPYTLPQLAQLPDLVMQHQLLCPDGIFVLEHGKTHSFTSHPCFVEQRVYGSVHFSFFRQKTEAQ